MNAVLKLDEDEFIETARTEGKALAAKLANTQRIAFVTPEPDWMSVIDHLPPYQSWATQPTRETKVITRWALPGKFGQLRVTAHYRQVEDFDSIYLASRGDLELAVTAEHRQKTIVRAIGRLHDALVEMRWEIVAFSQRTDQALVDAVAGTLYRITQADSKEELVALMAYSSRCGACGKPLRDEISKLIGIGPDCARRMDVPHTLDFARKVVRRRQELMESYA